MSCSRREFFSGASAFALGAGRLFAAPPGWKQAKKPNLVVGVISDTHLRTMPTSGRIDREWSGKYLAKALKHFRDANVDAVVHCGDFAHLGQVEEMQAHADAWNQAFPNNRAPAGHEVAKLFVAGNHDLDYDPSLFEERHDFLMRDFDGRRFVMIHYALMDWPKRKRGGIHLQQGHQLVLSTSSRPSSIRSLALLAEPMDEPKRS